MKTIIKYQIFILILFLNLGGISAQNSLHISNCTYKISGLSGDFNVNYKGDIKVADNDKSIKSISQGGYLEIEKKTFGNSRKLNIYPDQNGKVVYEYKEGFSTINFEPNGRKWMEEILPDVIRSAGIDVEGRVKRIYTNAGINGILNEIKSIESDFTSSKYYKVLINNEKLTESEYKLAIIALSNTISSDFEKSNVLKSVNSLYINNDALTEAFLTTVSGMSSDFEKSNVLKRLDVTNFSEKQQLYYLNTVNTMNSDFERSNVISYLLAKKTLHSNSFLLAVKVTAAMNSDFEKSKCYKTMLSKPADDKALTEIFDAVSQMNSDFEKGNLLKNGADNIKPAAVAVDSYFKALNSMNSDFERSNVLKSLIKVHSSDDALYIKILNSAALLNSDFEKSNVLTFAATRMPKSDKVKEEYIKAANTINGTHEYGAVMKAIR